MHLTRSLDGVACSHCGEESVRWWHKEKTETTLEVLATCDGCGFEYPKRFVDRSNDTSDDRLREIATEIVQ